jgi:diphthamide biosynthesis protein 4
MSYTPTYYEILDIPPALQNEPNIPVATLRSAYRRALLQNHPDKAQAGTNTQAKPTTYTIDQISTAFAQLSNPKLRAQYDRELRLQSRSMDGSEQKAGETFRTGVEIVDLDDLDAEEEDGIWYRSCRCGEDRGFLIREQDLEEAAEDGEISVGCRGCSLWLKVLFGVMEDLPDDKELHVSMQGNKD